MERWLKALLFLTGLILMVAFLTAAFPVELMAYLHTKLGLGDFPNQPITVYLARSTSLMYGVHGVMMVSVCYQWDRLHSLVPIFGYLHIVIGLSMFTIDLLAPMPWYWTAFEGLPVAAVGLLLLWMYGKAFPKHRGPNDQSKPSE